MALPGRLPQVTSGAWPTSNWSHGTLVTPPTPDEPLDALDRDDGSVAAVLDEAEDIINAIGAQVLAEVAGGAAPGRESPGQDLPPQALTLGPADGAGGRPDVVRLRRTCRPMYAIWLVPSVAFGPSVG